MTVFCIANVYTNWNAHDFGDKQSCRLRIMLRLVTLKLTSKSDIKSRADEEMGCFKCDKDGWAGGGLYWWLICNCATSSSSRWFMIERKAQVNDEAQVALTISCWCYFRLAGDLYYKNSMSLVLDCTIFLLLSCTWQFPSDTKIYSPTLIST